MCKALGSIPNTAKKKKERKIFICELITKTVSPVQCRNLENTKCHKGERHKSILPQRLQLLMSYICSCVQFFVKPGIVLGVGDIAVSRTSLYLCTGLPKGCLLCSWDALQWSLVTAAVT
jgi:hypothetical protein